MNKEKREKIIGMIEANFEVIDRGSEHFDREGGVDIDFIIFKGPLGKMKLEFISKPVIIDKKVIYSNRIGSDAKVEYIYSSDEKSEKMKAYKWDEGQNGWIEVGLGSFSIS